MPNVFDIAEQQVSGKQNVFDIAVQKVPGNVFDIAEQSMKPQAKQRNVLDDIDPLPEANITTFGPRAAGALVGGMATFVPSGLAGYAKLLTSGPEEAVKTIEEIQGFFPKILLKEDHEKEAFEKTPPMWALGKVNEYKEKIGDYVLDKTGDGDLAGLATTAFEAGVFLALPWLLKRVGSVVKSKSVDSLYLLDKDARVKKALADYEASKKGMPLLEPDKTPIRSEVPPKPKTTLQPAEPGMAEPEVQLRPDQRAVLEKPGVVYDEKPMGLLKPDETPVKSTIPPTVEQRLGKRPVYEGKSDPYRIFPEKEKSVFDVAEESITEAPEAVSAEPAAPKAKGVAEKPVGGELVPTKPKSPSDMPVLIRSRPTESGQLYLEFDASEGRIPTVDEITAFAKEKGYDAEVIRLKGMMGDIRNTGRFRLDVFKDGRISSDATKALSEEFGGTFQSMPSKILRAKQSVSENPLATKVAESEIAAITKKPAAPKAKATADMTKGEFDQYWVEQTKEGIKKEVAQKVSGAQSEVGRLTSEIKNEPDNPANQIKLKEIERLKASIDQQQKRLSSNIAKPSSFMTEAQYKYHKGEGTTLSMMGTQGVYEGVVKEVPKLKEYAQKVANVFDVESRFGEATETGFHAKNYFSKWHAWETRTLDKISEVAKIAKHDKANAGVEAVLSTESMIALKKAPEGIRQVAEAVLDFQEAIKKEYADRGIKLDFKTRIINDIKELIRNAEKSEIPELEKALAAAEDLQFLHIPTAMWIESKVGSPTGGKVLKLLATQERKSLNIKSLLDRGLIKPEDVNVFDIMASYGRRAGRDFALLDLKDAGIKDGMVSYKQTATNYVKIPAYESPIFADSYLHPVLADYIRGELLGKGLNLGGVGKVFALTKLSAFINPLILPMYDTVQHSMLALVNKWSVTSGKQNIPFRNLARGAKSYLKRTPDYYEALDNGLSSKPYNNPVGTYKDLVDWHQKNGTGKMLSVLEGTLSPKVILNAYKASFETAWQLDQMIRMGSYEMLREKGFSPRDAAQIAAKAHSDYASVPASTRRMLNVPFFTPTFKITMGKFYGQMLLDSAKAFTGKQITPKTAVYAGALAGTLIANAAYDMYMTKFAGFDRDELGRRYTKKVDTEQGEKELTITASSPVNMWQKYYFRAVSSFSPEVAKPWVRFFEQNKWEIQPLFRVAYEVAINDNGRGDKIYSEFDTTPVATGKALIYTTKSIVRLLGLLDRESSDKEGSEKFVEEYGRLTEILIRPFTFVYLRSPEDKRIGYKIMQVQKRFNQQLRRGEIEPRHVDEYVRQMEKLLNLSKKEPLVEEQAPVTEKPVDVDVEYQIKETGETVKLKAPSDKVLSELNDKMSTFNSLKDALK